MKIRVKDFITGRETIGELTPESDQELAVLVINGHIVDHWNYKAGGLRQGFDHDLVVMMVNNRVIEYWTKKLVGLKYRRGEDEKT